MIIEQHYCDLCGRFLFKRKSIPYGINPERGRRRIVRSQQETWVDLEGLGYLEACKKCRPEIQEISTRLIEQVNSFYEERKKASEGIVEELKQLLDIKTKERNKKDKDNGHT